ncbi:tetratricopeptide repeat-containing sensor histidine kinase [Tenacibaculum amylolyticum]|uniref:tetratricopeptide repeat-containing sensor histidine kinase n=1 Tax=Tenacibaculum amylolyticum TaxID=104269 RepID=UPI0038B42309
MLEKYYRSFLFFVLMSIVTFGQDKNEEKLLDTLYYFAVYNKDKEFKDLAYKVLHNSKSETTRIKSLTTLSFYHQKKGNYDSVIYYSNKALEILKNKEDTLSLKRKNREYHTLGVVNNSKGLLENAIEWHIKGINTSEKIKDSLMLLSHKQGLAEVYRKRKEYQKALALYEFSLQHAKDPNVIMRSYINIGVLLAEEKKIKESEIYFKKGLAFAKESKDLIAQVVILINLAENNHYESKNYKEAIIYYKNAIELTKKHDFKYYLSVAELGLARVYVIQDKYKEASRTLKLLLKLAKEEHYYKLEKDIYDSYEKLYVKQQNYKEAFTVSRKRQYLSDSIQAIQRDKEIKELEVKFNMQQKQNEIASLKKENQYKAKELKTQEKLKFLQASFLSIFLLLSIILAIVFYQKWKTQKLHAIKQEELNTEKVLSILKDQDLKIVKANLQGQVKERKEVAKELHDNLGNSIASIKLQVNAVKKSSMQLESVIHQLDNLYDVVRNFSHDILVKRYVKDNYVKQIKDYIEEVGKASRIKTEVHLYPEEEIDALDIELQYEFFSIIQELVTNTIKHANASFISLDINVLEGSINIIFEDNGDGFEISQKHKGIGLTNLEERISFRKGKVSIDSLLGRGTIINIEIPN